METGEDEVTAKHAKRKRSRPAPIYMRCMRLTDTETGEVFGALVPRYACDRRAMRERKIAVGTEVRAELRKPRNVKFHRLAHAIGRLLVDQVAGFDGLDAHAALKKAQAACGASCEPMELDLGPLGKASVMVPKSISFDEMDESEFDGLVKAVYDYIAANYWPGMTAAGIEAIVDMYGKGE